MLKIQNISKSFGYFKVWENINFELFPGDIFTLFGANGSGKTTMLKAIAGITSPLSGIISIDGENIFKSIKIRSKIGFLTHQTLFYHDLTCLENLRFSASLYKIHYSDSELISRLRDVGLKKWAHHPAKFFSRGMLQRLAICKTLLHNPDILLFDEPYTGLDEAASEIVSKTIRSFSEQGKIVLLVTHDSKQGYDIATKTAILANQSLSDIRDTVTWSYEDFHSVFSKSVGNYDSLETH